MAEPNVTTALIMGGVSLITLALSEVFKRWKSRQDRRAAEAAVEAEEADRDAKITDAANAAFKTIYDRLDGEISDLRRRLGVVEGELLSSKRECETLRAERDEARAEGQVLRLQVEQQRGEIANLNAVIEAQRRATLGLDHACNSPIAQL